MQVSNDSGSIVGKTIVTQTVGDRRILVIRHGKSMSNKQHVLTSDLTPTNPLTQKGRRQVQESAKRFVPLFKPDYIIASPLQRTQDTAQEVAKIAEMKAEEIILKHQLREPNFGSYENKPATEYLALFTTREHTFTKGAPDGESGDEQMARVTSLMKELLEEPQYAGKTIVLATHLYTFQHIHKYLTGKYIPTEHNPPNAAWCLFTANA